MKFSFGVSVAIVFVVVSLVEINGDALTTRYFQLFLPVQQTQTPYNEYQYISPEDPFNGRYDLGAISNMCPKHALFGSYNPRHRRATDLLTQIFMDQPDMDGMLSVSEAMRGSPYIHPKVWYNALLSAQLLRQPESLEMSRPSPMELFPSSFFPAPLLLQQTLEQECVLLDERFGADNGVENALWYFREDVQLNAHHWIWHLLHPFNSTLYIPRRGELFYYVHHEYMARYASERLSNGLLLPTPMDLQWSTVLEEGYRPHLTDGISTLNWADRHPYRRLSESLNTTFLNELLNFKITRDRVLESVAQGTVLGKDALYYLINHEDHINTLGELSEASNVSINPYFYGAMGFHNQAHQIIANVDVNFQPPGSLGVMGDAATSIRDPIFYRFHRFVDDIFLKYKAFHLKPYTPQGGELPLVFDGIKISNVKVLATDPNGSPVSENHLQTFWNMRRFNLDGGLDFNFNRSAIFPSVSICAKHLDHEEFNYEIAIENSLGVDSFVTVRIFMAPRYKSQDQSEQFRMSDQRKLFFSMDSFQTVLQPGHVLLKRKSVDSSLTTPWPRSFEEIRQEIESRVPSPQRVTCGCGFPHHLLLPKGTENGMVYDLFVMITNGAEDQVQEHNPQPNYGFPQPEHAYSKCQPSHIHCGIPGRNYPDSKPMGYPFDRRPYTIPHLAVHSLEQTIEHREVETIEDYVSEVPNMHVSQIVIQHRNELFGLHEYSEILKQ